MLISLSNLAAMGKIQENIWSIVKPIPNLLLRPIPIATGANSAMNQSEDLAITCNLVKAREISRVQDEIGFGFACHCLKNWREI